MLFRNLRKRATGEWLDVLFTVEGDTFSVNESSHRSDIAASLRLLADELEVVDSPTDRRSGVLLKLPLPPPGPPNPDIELREGIRAATTLGELKNALLGVNRPGRVEGRPL